MDRIKSLRISYIFLSVASLVLIALGSYVRATRAGMACPDWPLCNGQIVPDFSGEGILQEYLHRLVAGFVLILAGWLVARSALVRKNHPRLFRISLFLAVIVVIQAVFGGLTVLMKLEPWVVTVHLALGTLFFQVAVAMALRLSPGRTPVPQKAGGVSIALWTVVLAQMLLGAYLAASHASLACPRFPVCPNLFGPSGLAIPPALIYSHGLLGLLIFVLVVFLTIYGKSKGADDRKLSHLGPVLLGLTLVQVAVGFLNIYLLIPVHVVVTHQVLAQFILMCALSLSYRRRLV